MLSSSVRLEIKNLIKNKIDEKLNNYEQETSYSPFFEAIFDKEVIVKASIMQSLYTTFGMSIYEQIAVILAKNAGYTEAQRQYHLLGEIDDNTELLLRDLYINPLRNKDIEIEKIRKVIKKGRAIIDNDGVVDVYFKDKNNIEWYIDIKTVKPNLSEFSALRKKLLRWAGLRLSQNPRAKIKTCIGIPYNPYYPEDYHRWTGKDCHVEEILVQNDLWKTFAGEDVFQELLEICKEVGAESQKKIVHFVK